MRTRSRATCPELAEASGLSLVTVHKVIRRLTNTGEIRTGNDQASRGGRPAQVYEYEARYGQRVLLYLTRQDAVIRARVEMTDLQGHTLNRQQNTYASLEQESLDGILDTMLNRMKVSGIALIFSPTQSARADLIEHLRKRYHCPVVCANAAEALADDQEDGTATLYLRRREAPVCSLRSHARTFNTGRLDLLHLLSTWEQLDYADHTLVEEMISRLIHIITCTLAPDKFTLHADFWSTRLTDRIRYNTLSKLKGQSAPELEFRFCSEEKANATIAGYYSSGHGFPPTPDSP